MGKYRKVFVMIPFNSTSGGAESLHQLVSCINEYGGSAFVVYCDAFRIRPIPTPEKFAAYCVPAAERVEDSPENLLVVPESFSGWIYRFKRMQKSIWWLSLDFYLFTIPSYHARHLMAKYRIPGVFFPAVAAFSRMLRGRSYHLEDRQPILHFYNSEYVRRYLLSQSVPEAEMQYLCGMVSDRFLESARTDFRERKEKTALYNPAKDRGGYAQKVFATERIRRLGLSLIPLAGLRTEQIVELMARSCLYVDFGYFPGPERIPREAVLLGCNIVTSAQGSAGNPVDVPIPSAYKFEPSEENIEKASEAVAELAEHYAAHYAEFDAYRQKVLGQKELFQNTIREYLI